MSRCGVSASRLLGARLERPCDRRAAEQRDELAAPHVEHSLRPGGVGAAMIAASKHPKAGGLPHLPA